MKTVEYLSVNNIIAAVHRDLGYDELSEADLIEWIGEGLQYMLAPQAYKEELVFIEVEQHKAVIPQGLRYIVQMARMDCTKDTIVEEDNDLPDAEEVDSKYELVFPKILDCTGQVIGNYKVAWTRRTTIDHDLKYFGWNSTKIFRDCFKPIKLSNHTFFKTVVCEEKNRQLYHGCNDEYTIDSPYLLFSFEEGTVALVYQKLKLDDDGYPMVPEGTQYRNALIAYIRYKLARREMDMNTQGAVTKVQFADRDWQHYCMQAKNHSMKLKGPDEHQNMQEQRGYLLPRQYRYYGWYGSLSQPESAIYKRTHAW